MKNKSTLLFIAIIAMTLAGCGGTNTGKINELSDLKGKVIGFIAWSPDTKGMESMITSFAGEPKEAIFFNKTSDEVAAVLAGKIDAFLSPKLVADYYSKRNPKLKVIEAKKIVKGVIFMALRNEDQVLRDQLDSAITILQGNGTLKTLEDQWITNLPASNEPSHTNIPKIEGAETVYVGVAGDFPPLDYIAADGRPAGYNVATLTEIGKILKINFEFVSIETQARFAALTSKKIDVIFCNLENNTGNGDFSGELRNNSWISTNPYYTFLAGYFLVRR